MLSQQEIAREKQSTPNDSDHLKVAYQEICASYHSIDDIRMKLLGLLPLATGAGVFLLLNKEIFSTIKDTEVISPAALRLQGYLSPIGLFGFVITLGVFAFEIYGIKKCSALIAGGKEIEGWLHIDGAFVKRPPAVLRFINEPFAGGIIYSAVLAAWAYIGLVFSDPPHAGWVPPVVFIVGLVLSIGYHFQLNSEGKIPADIIHINQEILDAEETGNQAKLEHHLHPDFTIVRASGEKQNRKAYLAAVSANRKRGRKADRVEVRVYGESAVFTCRVTTSLDKGGKSAQGNFWNTRLFLRQGDKWLCAAWQVMKIGDD
jgi:Domain of unknown function (DUF4440)